ncbi:MAG: adenylosuccinate lyase [Oscillospiraceae bacterium]|nr:adenylosuccinate lyase [Oscillospiraceae bacterium]
MIDRYTRPEMAALWTKEHRFQSWLDVELAAADAWSRLGVVPVEDAAAMRRNARFTVERVEEIEQTTRHDVVAFTRCVAEGLGHESKWLHYGLTSTDVVDTALSSVLNEACGILRDDVKALTETLKNQAKRWKNTPIMGRTHGVHAEPTTLGLKFALWYAESRRNLVRLERARESITVGKISGAVGTYANVDPRVEVYVCQAMGLQPSPISTQTLQRDRHAEFISTLGIVASCLEKYATEIRLLQQTELREVEEPFRSGQKGSSAMPHKRNPINCEQICGLARLVRSYVTPALEDIALWHERDISHSSVERVVLPDATQLLDFMLHKLTGILGGLFIYPDNMTRSMERSLGLPFSQHVLLALIGKGMLREDAYDAVQRLAMQSWGAQEPFREILESDEDIRVALTAKELDECFNPAYHQRYVEEIYARLGLND